MTIITSKDLPKIRDEHKDKKIIFCSGNFDLTHAGHIAFFEDCKKQGDILVVAIGGDKILKINKGEGRPILNEKIRLKTVDSLKPVDYCLIDDISTLENPLLLLDVMLAKLMPEGYVVNEEGFNLSYRQEITKKLGIELIILERIPPEGFDGISTTEIIKRVKALQEPIEIKRHAGVVIIESEDGKKFLFSKYDDTFPLELYRENINFIGGGNSENDLSPRHVIEREISEEFSTFLDEEEDATLASFAGEGYQKPEMPKSFASEEDITKIREAILKNLEPLQDFIIDIPSAPNGPAENPFKNLFSVYYSKIPSEIFTIVKRNLESRKSLVTEGLLTIVRIDDLISRKIESAWATNPIMQYYLNQEIPNPREVKITPTGLPRNSFKDYLKEFKFEHPVKKD